MENNTNASKSFVFYTEWSRCLRSADAATRLAVYDAIVAYAAEGREPEGLEGAAAVAFEFIRCDLDRSLAHRAQVSEARAAAGRKGGRARTAKQMQAKPSLNDNVDVNVNGNANENDNENETVFAGKDCAEGGSDAAAVPAAVSEVEEYCKAEGLAMDAARFFDYYSSLGWRIGTSRVCDWRALARAWAARELRGGGSAGRDGVNAASRDGAGALKDGVPECRRRRNEAGSAEAERRRADDAAVEADRALYRSMVPGAFTDAAVLSYPEFCIGGFATMAPADATEAIEAIAAGRRPKPRFTLPSRA